MAIVTTDNKYYSEIATAIREMTGASALYKPAQMAAAIKSIQAGEAMTLEAVREICGYDPSGLPKGYTLLEYVQSSGTQYIDTGFKPNQDTKVVMDVDSQSGIDHVLFSARTSASSNVLEMIWSNSSGCYRFYYNNGNVNMNGISVTPATRRTITVDKNTATIDGYSVSRTYATFQCECNMVLLARSTLGTIGAYTTGKLYACQIYDNGTLIRDFVPCISSSGKTGLFDKVAKVFYHNAGTGKFYSNVDPMPELPSGYTLLNYIQSSGTQHIDTGVSGSVPLKVELTIESLTGTSTVDNMPMASTDGTNTTVPVYWSYSTWYTEVGKTNGTSASGTLTDNTKYDVVFTATSAKYSLVVNGLTLVEKTGSLTGSTKSLFLFARNKNGTASHQATAKVYGLKMYSNNVLVRDFVPCKNSSGAIGLYDTVNATFYANAGSGSFTGG